MSTKLPAKPQPRHSHESGNSAVWGTKSIGELFDIGAGKSVTPTARGGERSHPFLRTSNVFWGRIDVSQVSTMHFSDDEIGAKDLRKGDLLVCEGGDIGRSAIWNGELERCSFQNHLHRLRPRQADTAPLFVMYYLQAGFTQLGIYEGAGNKTTIPNLSRSRLAALEVPAPPKPEQQKIAAVLWKMQRAIATQDRLIAATRDLKQSAMQHIFTHGLRGKPTRETRFGDVPANWREESLGSCCQVQTGITKGRRIPAEEAIEVPYLRVANVQDGHLDLREMKTITIRRSELVRFRLQEGDVVLTEGGDFDQLGRGFIWHGQVPDCAHQNHVFAVRTDSKRLLPEFLAYLVQSPYGKSYFLEVAHKTTNLACINSTKLKAFPTLVPDLDEQRDITAALAILDRKLAHHQQKRTALNDLFQTTLHQLMTAQTRVADLDIDISEVTAPSPQGVAA